MTASTLNFHQCDECLIPLFLAAGAIGNRGSTRGFRLALTDGRESNSVVPTICVYVMRKLYQKSEINGDISVIYFRFQHIFHIRPEIII